MAGRGQDAEQPSEASSPSGTSRQGIQNKSILQSSSACLSPGQHSLPHLRQPQQAVFPNRARTKASRLTPALITHLAIATEVVAVIEALALGQCEVVPPLHKVAQPCIHLAFIDAA